MRPVRLLHLTVPGATQKKLSKQELDDVINYFFEELLRRGFTPENIKSMTPYQAILIVSGAEKKIKKFDTLDEFKKWQMK